MSVAGEQVTEISLLCLPYGASVGQDPGAEIAGLDHNSINVTVTYSWEAPQYQYPWTLTSLPFWNHN